LNIQDDLSLMWSYVC